MESEVLVIVPTYNEAGNIKKLITHLLNLPIQVDVLIVDDGSPDGTTDVVKTAQEQEKDRIHLIQRPGKLGLGTAYVAGFTYALEHKYKYICEMDADYSHDPNDVPRLVHEVKNGNADVAIGSRYSNGISIIDWPLSRLILSYTANFYARLITGLPVKDTTAGFKCFRREVLENVNLTKIKSNGYAFQIEMHYRAMKAGFQLKEVSIIFRERTEGVSKMSKRIVFEAVWMVWALKLWSLIGRL
ncbi:MAG: polyprenol monophosphomannose synthase [Balneolales bacterium]